VTWETSGVYANVDYRVLDASKNPINQAGMTPQEHAKINGQDTKRSRHELVFVFKNGKEMHRNNIMVGQYGRDRTNVWEYPLAISFSRNGDARETLAGIRRALGEYTWRPY
jgi:hypothetical protein